MNNNKLICELTNLSSALYDGDCVVNIISQFDGNWKLILEDIKTGSTLSEAIKKHPFSELNEFENNMLIELIHCGELGGVLEITLDRAMNYIRNIPPYPLSVKGYLHTVGLMLSCGVPILKAIKSVPIDVQFNDIKVGVYNSIKNGDEFYTSFKSYITDEEYKSLHEAEYNGSLPEFLITLKD